MALQIAKKFFTIHDYYQMAASGIIQPGERVELINGEVIKMSPIGSLHAACVGRLTDIFVERSKKNYHTWVQNPLRIDDYSEPEPDVMLLKKREDYYANFHPKPADVLLLIEVADTTLDYDRNIKAPLYAHAEISEYWLIDLNTHKIEVYTKPKNGSYQSHRTFKAGESIAIEKIAGLVLPVKDVLG